MMMCRSVLYTAGVLMSRGPGSSYTSSERHVATSRTTDGLYSTSTSHIVDHMLLLIWFESTQQGLGSLTIQDQDLLVLAGARLE